jgi:hypothetical protein
MVGPVLEGTGLFAFMIRSGMILWMLIMPILG